MKAREFASFIGWTAMSDETRNQPFLPLDTTHYGEHAQVIVTDGITQIPVKNVLIDGEMNILVHVEYNLSRTEKL